MFYVTSGITSGSDIDVLLLWHFEDETNKKVEGSPFQLSSRKPNDNVDNIFAKEFQTIPLIVKLNIWKNSHYTSTFRQFYCLVVAKSTTKTTTYRR